VKGLNTIVYHSHSKKGNRGPKASEKGEGKKKNGSTSISKQEEIKPKRKPESEKRKTSVSGKKDSLPKTATSTKKRSKGEKGRVKKLLANFLPKKEKIPRCRSGRGRRERNLDSEKVQNRREKREKKRWQTASN